MTDLKTFSHFIRATFFTLLLIGIPTVVSAQVTVSASTLVRVGINPLTGSEGSMATEVLSADLKRTGMISPVAGGSGDYLASGEVTDAGVTGKLTKKTGEEVFSQTFSGKARAATHAFADAITKAVTGLPGIASSKLAFISDASGAKELYLGDIDGFGMRAITHDGTISASPSLNHDATKLVYTSYKSGYPDIYLIDLSNGSRNRIAFFPGINSGPEFSPDGSQIAMTLSKDGNPEVYVMPTGGGTPIRITRTRGAETSPSWSPTGDRLVYSSDDRGSPQLFISSSSDVSEMDHLVTGNSYCTKPDWSPDGKWICFTTRIGGQFQIGLFDVASRTGHLLTTEGGQDPVWTADSRHLVYSNNGHLYLLDAVSRQSLPIETSVGGAGEPTVSR